MAKLEALKLGQAAGRRFKFTRKTSAGKEIPAEVYIVPLTPLQIDRARLNAENYVASLDGADKMPASTREEILRDAREIETLALALRDPDATDECWAGSAQMRAELSVNETALLLKAYVEHQDEVGPLISSLSEERFKSILDAIVETGSTDPLVFCDSHTQRDFIITTAIRLWTSQMDKSSGTSDSFEPETASSSDSLSDANVSEPQSNP